MGEDMEPIAEVEDVEDVEEIDLGEYMDPPAKKPCTACERLAGVVGALLGAALVAIALDLATGGKISSAINRVRPPALELDE